MMDALDLGAQQTRIPAAPASRRSRLRGQLGLLGPAFERVGGLPPPRVTQVDLYHRGPSERYPSA